MRPARTQHASSVAVHPRTGEFYIENNFSSPGLLHVYGPKFAEFGFGEPRKIPLGTPPGTSIQGIAFSPSGKLYVACNGPDGVGGVYAFQVSPNKATLQRYLYIEEHPGDASPFGSGEEMEGLTVRDVTWTDGTRNQIHVFLLHNIFFAKDNAWFKHIGISDTRV